MMCKNIIYKIQGCNLIFIIIVNTFITVILTIIIVIHCFLYYFHIAIVIIVTNIIFIIITIFLLSLLSLSLQLQLPSISSIKSSYFFCLGTTMKIRLFYPFCVIPASFVFSPYINKMVLFIFCIKCSFYDLFIYFFHIFLNQELQIL